MPRFAPALAFTVVLVSTSILAALFAWLPAERDAGPALLVRGERPLPIVLRADAIPAERTAADELAAHLRLVTGRKFPILPEALHPAARPAIHVGATGFAAARGVACDDRGGEGWTVAPFGGQLVLCGGRPRGTLYAVYRFLEDDLGVRWWTPFERDVPSNAEPALPRASRSGAPVFAYRDMNGVVGPRVFGARSRLNGHFTGLRRAHGGSQRYGPPSQVHNFFRYVPPDEFFANRPDFFSEVGGLRWAEETQLCLTAPGLFDVVLERMDRYVTVTRQQALRHGVAPAALFDFSQNDWGRPCDCANCNELVAAEGSHAGAVIAFVNRLAAAVVARHPGVLVDTLAYGWSFEPPRTVVAGPDVVVRLAPLYGRDFSKSLAHPAHDAIRAAVTNWAERTAHLRVWDYAVTFGDQGDLPRPNLLPLAADLRFYRDAGVEGVFLQQDAPVAADMVDLKRWVLIRLLEDPGRDVDALVREFTDGYYGPAGVAIRRYREALAEAAVALPATIGFDAGAGAFAWLDRDFLLAAQALFDEATRRVAGDADRLRRVRHARLALDAATLHRLEPVATGGALPFDRGAVVRRWRATSLEQIDLRLSPGVRDDARDEVERQAAAWLAPERPAG